MTNNAFIPKNDEITATREQLRFLISSFYQFQHARTATGNRLCAIFKRTAGMEPTDKLEDNPEIDKFLNELLKEFKTISEGIAARGDKARFINSRDEGVLIKTEIQYKMIEVYNLQFREEAIVKTLIKKFLDEHPLWTHVIRSNPTKYRGIGELTAAMIISLIDIEKCDYVSSLWRYCGLSTVRVECEKLKTLDKRIPSILNILDDKRVNEGIDFKTANKIVSELKTAIDGWVDMSELSISHLEQLDPINLAERLYSSIVKIQNLLQSQFDMEGGYFRDEGLGRKSSHLVERKYTDKNGNIKTKLSLQYSPAMKLLLLGKFPEVAIKINSPYMAVKLNYLHRYKHSPAHAAKNGMHLQRMANRQMAKWLMYDLWKDWRTLLGLPVPDEYAVGKLGKAPHSRPSISDLIQENENNGIYKEKEERKKIREEALKAKNK